MTTSATAQANIDLQNRIYALFSAGKMADVLRLATDDVVVEMIPFGQIHHGHGGFREFMTAFATAFPDLRIEPRRQIADDGRVAAEFVAHGTHKGPLMTPNGPIPPTGKKVVFTVCEVWDIRDGKVCGLRNYQDAASILRQIGAA
jgi:steroid delta-isomerase-like uncharacterized protein